MLIYIDRYSPAMDVNPYLNNSRSIDILYLDNTYCDESCVFPTRVRELVMASWCDFVAMVFIVSLCCHGFCYHRDLPWF